MTVPITDMEVEECPISVKSRFPQMEVLVSEIFHFQSIKEYSGAIPFGPDTNEWPAKWFDFVLAARLEDRRIDIEREEWRSRMRG